MQTNTEQRPTTQKLFKTDYALMTHNPVPMYLHVKSPFGLNSYRIPSKTFRVQFVGRRTELTCFQNGVGLYGTQSGNRTITVPNDTENVGVCQ